MADRQHSSPFIDCPLHPHIDARELSTKNEVETSVHDPVAIGRGNIRVGRDIEEVPVLDVNPVLSKSASPLVAKVSIHIA
jgi:hypothetical protein